MVDVEIMLASRVGAWGGAWSCRMELQNGIQLQVAAFMTDLSVTPVYFIILNLNIKLTCREIPLSCWFMRAQLARPTTADAPITLCLGEPPVT